MENNRIPKTSATEPDYLDHLIQDAIDTRPGFAELWEPDGLMLALSKERANLGLSQAEVASRMGVPRLAVVRMENDPSTVAFGRIVAYAKAVGATLSVQVGGGQPAAKPARRGRPVAARAT